MLCQNVGHFSCMKFQKGVIVKIFKWLIHMFQARSGVASIGNMLTVLTWLTRACHKLNGK